MTLPYAFGEPPAHATLRASNADFVVVEDLGFAPDGNGEHVFVRLLKDDANTAWVADQLARFCGVAPNLVSYAGLKDRNALTEQTFSVHLPGKLTPDFSQAKLAGVQILSVQRHSRKLHRGALKGNRFEIVLRALRGEHDAVEHRIATIAAHGVPNYFGEQRFGHDHGNIEQARALFANPRKRVPRHLESLYLSAARSEIFNQLLAARVTAGNWNTLITGDVPMLEGSHSVFGPEPITPELLARAAALDLHPTGPLWGKGTLRSTDAAAELEQAAALVCADLAAGLSARGLNQERRALRLAVPNLRHEWLETHALKLHFSLPPGCYATTVIREIAIV
jgi:tRNA pseudouridine13 synthase